MKRLRADIDRDSRLGGPSQRASATSSAASCWCAIASSGCSIRNSSVPRAFDRWPACGMYDDDAPAAGIVTGIGRVHGREVMVVANDATVKGGTYYPITVTKHLRAQEIAMENRLPCVYLVDSGRRVPAAAGRGLPRSRSLRPDLLQPGADVGARHPAGRGRDGLVHGGRRLRAGDVRRERHRARTRARFSSPGRRWCAPRRARKSRAEELGRRRRPHAPLGSQRPSGRRRRARAGNRALDARRISARAHLRRSLHRDQPEDPYYDPAELYGIIPADPRKPYDVREVIARIVDGSRMHEFKARYGPRW